MALVLLPCAVATNDAGRPAASDAIRLDQVGYLPQRLKLAVLAGDAAADSFRVRRAGDGSEALRGSVGPARMDPDSGDRVRLLDFSTLRESGAFYLDLPGVGVSHEFEIGEAVFADTFVVAARAFYGQRCGTAVDLAPRHPGYRHGACHVDADARMHPSSGASGAIEASGGWHDAGDYGKYVVNSGIAMGELLWAYELYPGRAGTPSLAIPESANGTPDLLDEARWNLDWMLKMQATDGGVWHKLTSERFGSFVMPELDDGGARYVIGTGSPPYKGSCATADFAAVMAVAARVYAPFDAAFARRALAAAERAWAWVVVHPDVVFRNPPGVLTGEYGDADCSDERLWAAAELFRTTGRAPYHQAFLAGAGGPMGPGPQSWSDVRNLARATYALTGTPPADPAVRARIRAGIVDAAQDVAARTAANGYRVSLKTTDYVWGSNGVAANYGVLLALADAVQPNPAFVEAAADNLHYLLGRNTFGLSWVTQVGDRPFLNPHHRPSGADGNAAPWPGLLSGGPNARGGDPVLDALPVSPPARRYRDLQASFASNEVAINWNAALVFLLASQLPATR